MAKSRYSVEQKKEYVMAYREATGSNTFLNAEQIARWCNETYMLVDELHGYDFRRPKEMKEWFEKINENIGFTVSSGNGIIRVVTASLIDIDHVIRTCRNTEQLRMALQSANKRFGEVIDTNQKLASELKAEKEERMNQQRELAIIKDNFARLQKELAVKERKWKNSMSEIKKKLAEEKRTEKILMKYISKYIADPVAADHFANELHLLITYPGKEIVLPEHMKELIEDERPFGTIISEFDEWIGAEEEALEEAAEFDEEDLDEAVVEAETVKQILCVTDGETAALNMLEDL